MVKFQPVCRDCENRKVGCHNECQTYLDTKREYERKRDEERKIKYAEQKIDDFDVENRIRIIERTRRNV